MQEYSRITIEKSCRSHPKTKKSTILWGLVELSCNMECESTEDDVIESERIRRREKNPELWERWKLWTNFCLDKNDRSMRSAEWLIVCFYHFSVQNAAWLSA